MAKVYTQKNDTVWVAPDGPNTQPFLLSCHDVADIVEPAAGKEIVQCMNDAGTGWDTVAERITPPGNVTGSLSRLTPPARDYLEKITNPFSLYVIQYSGGRPNQWNLYERVNILRNCRITQKTRSAMVHHTEDGEVSRSFEIIADPGVPEVAPVTVDRLTCADTNAVNDIWMNTDQRAYGDYGVAIEPGDFGIAVCDAGAGVTANVYLSTDGGSTWTVCAADPFAINMNIVSCLGVRISASAYRWIVGMENPAGAQGMIAYSDNNGAAWTTVNIGGAAAGHGSNASQSLWVKSNGEIFLASAAGYIYRSQDYGVSWTAVETGTITAGDYNAIHFDPSGVYGMAVAAAGIIALTRDGGVSWFAGTTIAAAPALNTGVVLDANKLWVGTATGLLYYSVDFGVTWTGRTGWSGSGVGQVRSLRFSNDHIAFMVRQTAGPVGVVLRSANGGFSWEPLTTFTNAGLNGSWCVHDNLLYLTGEVVGAATGVIGRVIE